MFHHPQHRCTLGVAGGTEVASDGEVVSDSAEVHGSGTSTGIPVKSAMDIVHDKLVSKF